MVSHLCAETLGLRGPKKVPASVPDREPSSPGQEALTQGSMSPFSAQGLQGCRGGRSGDGDGSGRGREEGRLHLQGLFARTSNPLLCFFFLSGPWFVPFIGLKTICNYFVWLLVPLLRQKTGYSRVWTNCLVYPRGPMPSGERSVCLHWVEEKSKTLGKRSALALQQYSKSVSLHIVHGSRKGGTQELTKTKSSHHGHREVCVNHEPLQNVDSTGME